MTPKERRDRLFKDRKPIIRYFDAEDWKWMYGAYRYPDPPGGQEDFEAFRNDAMQQLAQYTYAFIAEDRNQRFKGKYGPVGIIPAMYNGWTLEPHVQWFPWATTMNKIRSSVAFMMFARYSPDIGITEIRSLKEHADFFKGLKDYAPIYFIRKIPYGDIRGDSYLFYIRGKKQGIEQCRL